MNSKKSKALKKLFLQSLKDKNITDYGPQFNIRGEIVEGNLWRQFKKQYERNSKEAN